MLAFVDASAFKAYYDSNDTLHPRAAEFMQKVLKREIPVTALLTTDYVLDEAITITRFANSHETAVELAQAAFASKFMKVIYTGEQTFREAFELFRKYSDKEWSFTDCVSFTTMKKLQTSKAFTFDAHFRQTGFEILP